MGEGHNYLQSRILTQTAIRQCRRFFCLLYPVVPLFVEAAILGWLKIAVTSIFFSLIFNGSWVRIPVEGFMLLTRVKMSFQTVKKSALFDYLLVAQETLFRDITLFSNGLTKVYFFVRKKCSFRVFNDGLGLLQLLIVERVYCRHSKVKKAIRQRTDLCS